MIRGAIEQQAAQFVATTSWEAIPEHARERSLDMLLDALACAIAGRTAPARDDFAAAVRQLTGTGQARVVGDLSASPLGAALLNGWQTTATTMCDVYRPRMCHVTPVVLPGVLAAAEASTRLDELRAGFALATELTVRLCAAMDAELYQGARWHAPGVIGPYGSATAAARVKGLDASTLARAWGAASLHSAGTFSAIGSPGVKVTQARAAGAGVTAVELTLAGHGGGLDPWTHPDGGLFEAYAGHDPEAVVRGLGDDWMLFDVSLRRWPAASSLQSVVECVLEASTGDDEVELTIELPPQSFKLCAEMGWGDQLTALQSARWVAAVCWLDRSCWLEQFAESRRRDPRAGALAESVRVVEDVKLPSGAARVRAGGELVAERLTVIGSPERPLDRAAVLEKLARAAGPARAARIAEAVVSGETAGELLDLLAG